MVCTILMHASSMGCGKSNMHMRGGAGRVSDECIKCQSMHTLPTSVILVERESADTVCNVAILGNNLLR